MKASNEALYFTCCFIHEITALTLGCDSRNELTDCSSFVDVNNSIFETFEDTVVKIYCCTTERRGTVENKEICLLHSTNAHLYLKLSYVLPLGLQELEIGEGIFQLYRALDFKQNLSALATAA